MSLLSIITLIFYKRVGFIIASLRTLDKILEDFALQMWSFQPPTKIQVEILRDLGCGTCPKCWQCNTWYTMGPRFIKVQWYSFKKFGHIANQCKKNYNYCKGTEQLLSECQKRPQNRNNRAYCAVTNSSSSDSASPPITHELVQQMIQSTFSTLGLTSKSRSSSSLWYLDSRVSNHMDSHDVSSQQAFMCISKLESNVHSEENG